MTARIRKFSRISARERRLLIGASILLAVSRLVLWVVPFRFVWPYLSQTVSEREATDPCLLRSIIWAIDTAAKWVPGSKCLVKAMAARIIMGHYGYACSVRLGVNKNQNGKFQAHAWVERNGDIIVGNLSDLAAYSTLAQR